MADKVKRQEALIQEIESTFVDGYRPNDDELLVNPQFGAADKLIRDFKGKSWQDITLETLYRHRLHLPLFRAEAFRYFLPAFLTLSLQASSGSKYNPDDLLEPVFYSLISPAGKVVWTLKLKAIIGGLSAEQKLAVTEFIQYVLERHPQFVTLYSEQVQDFWHV